MPESKIILAELQKQALKLPIGDRLQLVQSILTSIKQETQISISPITKVESIPEDLDPWTQSLIGVIQINSDR